MDPITFIINFFVHLDVALTVIAEELGVLTYIILFLVIFAETGFVVTPFLPGDSLLFAAGALAAIGALDVVVILITLTIAAVLGDTVNYWIGHFLGKRIVNNPNIPFVKPEHIEKTERFYEKHGGKTIVLARFIPIIRTFAPFVAGVGTMDYRRFIIYNVVGGVTWIFLFTLAGYFFGNIPAVEENFSLVIFAIIGLSVLPMLYEYVKSRREKNKAEEAVATEGASKP